MKTALIALLIIFILAIGGLSYLGVFSKVLFTEKTAGPYIFVYDEHKGDYKNVNTVMDKIYNSLLNDEQIVTTKGMGIYYDDPKTTPTEQLRSDVGVLLEEKDSDKVPLLEEKYKIKKIAPFQALVAEFPYKNVLSIIIGVFKVYPALQTYVTQQQIAMQEIMEIYDKPNKTIFYIMPLRAVLQEP